MKFFVVLLFFVTSVVHAMGVSCEKVEVPCNEKGDTYHCTYYGWAYGEFCASKDVGRSLTHRTPVSLDCRTKMTAEGQKVLHLDIAKKTFVLSPPLREGTLSLTGDYDNGLEANVDTDDGARGSFEYVKGGEYASTLTLEGSRFQLNCSMN